MPASLDYDLQRGDVAAVVEALRGGVPVDARNEYGRTALVCAVRNGNVAMA
jgi:ankyrin repeat protein